MYCPKCSQQQISEKQRFCSRCGFALSAVAELLATGGVPPINQKESPRRNSPRYAGVRQGVILLMLSIILVPLVDVIGPPYHEALIFMFLIAGFARIVYALIFQEGAAKQHSVSLELRGSQMANSKLSDVKDIPTLQSANSISATDFIDLHRETSIIAPTSGVTDNTTQLLDDQTEIKQRPAPE
jgi:hypothetical protein